MKSVLLVIIAILGIIAPPARGAELTDKEWAKYSAAPWLYTPRGQFTPEIWEKYVRAPYLLGKPYKNGKALILQGQEPLDLKPLPGSRKVILCFYCPKGEKPIAGYREKIAQMAAAANMSWRKMGAAIAGDTRLSDHGLRFPFKDGKLHVQYVEGKMSAQTCQEHPQAAEGISRECRFSYEEEDVQMTLNRENYAFVIFAHKYWRKDSGGQNFWVPAIFPQDRTCIFSGEMLSDEVAAMDKTQQMGYLGHPNNTTVIIPQKRMREILPTSTDLITQMDATGITIGAFTRYLAEALGAVPDTHPQSIMGERDWINTRLHFFKRSDVSLKPTYFPPAAATVLQSWVE